MARVTATLALMVTLVAGCGGGERQDADEPAGEYRLDVTGADFPAEQSLAQRATMAIEVRNAGAERVPTVAVTVETEPATSGAAPRAFGDEADPALLADPSRAIWVLDQGPRGTDTAYANTWASGPLDPGQRRRFEWDLTAVTAGAYTIGYRVRPGLDGRARLAQGSEGADGSFEVRISREPREGRVRE